MSTTHPKVRVISFKLTISGLIIQYSSTNSMFIVEYDCTGTCEELERSNFIRGYLKGFRVPPQIMKGCALEFMGWPHFVKSFKLSKEMVQVIAQKHYKESEKIKECYN